MKNLRGLWPSLLRRIALGVLTMWAVSIITFALLFMVPVNPAQAIGGERASATTIQEIRVKYGLDKPAYVQYERFVGALLTNKLKSYRNDDLVLSAIARRFPATLLLAAAGFAVWLIVAIPLGLYTAGKSRTAIDRIALGLGIVAISIPTFWLGRLLQHFLGYRWGWFSVGGDASLHNLPLPALTLGIGGAALYSRLLHSSLLSVMNQNYVRAARARGLSEAKVMYKHALKNALIPLVTLLGMEVASLLSGLIFTEKIFGWPGIGSLAVDSVLSHDVPMIMGTVLFSALAVVIASIAVDVIYHLIDPRVKFD